MKQIGRKFLATLLSVALCFSTLPPTPVLAKGWEAGTQVEQSQAQLHVYAATYNDSTGGEAGSPYLGEGAVVVSASSIAIDGVTLSRSQFSSAMSGFERLSDTPSTSAVSEYAKLFLVSAAAAGGLIELGRGIELTFLKLVIGMRVADILASHSGSSVFRIKAGTIQGVTRDIVVVVTDAGGVVIDGVAVGASWLTYDIVSYIADHIESIEVVGEDAPTGDTVLSREDTIAKEAVDDVARYIRQLRTSELRTDPSVVVGGYYMNGSTLKFAIGVKLSHANEELQEILEKLPSEDILAKYGEQFSIGIVIGQNCCAEDACVGALGGRVLGENKTGSNVEVIPDKLDKIKMAPPVRPRREGPIPKAVCKTCEDNYKRIRFIEGTTFESDGAK